MKITTKNMTAILQKYGFTLWQDGSVTREYKDAEQDENGYYKKSDGRLTKSKKEAAKITKTQKLTLSAEGWPQTLTANTVRAEMIGAFKEWKDWCEINAK